MIQVLINTQDATRIQSSGGTSTVKYLQNLGTGVNGQKYIYSIWVKNNGATAVFVTSATASTGQLKVQIPAGKFTLISGVFVGTAAAALQFRFETQNIGDSFDITAWNPRIYRSQFITENLLNTDFVTGWGANSGATVTVTQGQTKQIDYTKYIEPNTLVIDDKLNQPSTCSFNLQNIDDTFIVPPRESYVQVFSNQYNKYSFTGFIANDIQKDFIGLNNNTPSQNFQTYRFIIQASGDELLLGSKAVPILPPFVNLGAGQILATLANALAPGFFDVTSKCLSGDLVPYMEYNPNKTWVDIAKQLADQFRYRVRILNKVLFYQPWGDQTYPVSYDETKGERNFDPSGLKTSIFDSSLVNDAFVLGDVEAGDNHEDYFVGDGFTSNFPFRYTTFESDNASLLQEDWSQSSINTTQWFEQDPTNAITPAGALNVNGGTNRFGETFLYLRTGIDLGTKIILEHGEFFPVGQCSGAIIGGVYDNATTFAEVSGSGQCECGFDIRPAPGFNVAISVSGVSGLQIQPRRLGQLVGTPVITQQNHYYILRTIINGRAKNRYSTVFKSFTGAIISGGTNTAQADITWVISDINLNSTNPNQPGFVNLQPPITDTRFTLENQTVPAFAVYNLLNISNANFTIQYTNVFDPPQATLSVASLSGVSGAQLPILPQNVGSPLSYELGFGLGRQVATIGQGGQSSIGAGSDGSGSVLQFYSDSIPGVGSRIRCQAWEAKTAIARVQDSTSIAKESSIVGDDGHRMAMVTDFKPLPRSSEECELAGKALLLDRTQPLYQGSYTVDDIFFDFIHNDFPRSGEFFTINSPKRNINNLQVMVSEVQIKYYELWQEKANITTSFGPTKFADNLLATFTPKPENTLMPKDTAAQPTPVQLANVGSSFAPDLDFAKLESATNYAAFSQQLDQAPWTTIGSVSVASNNATDPLGGQTADTISYGAKGANTFFALDQVLSTIGIPKQNTPYTFSIWLKVASGTAQVELCISDEVTTTAVLLANITTTWQKFVVTQLSFPANNHVLDIQVRAPFTPATGAFSVQAWGAQFEVNDHASQSYAPTTNNAPQTYPPGLGFDSTTAYFDLGVVPVSAVEVRRVNTNWGVTNNDLLGRFTTRTFSMPRIQFDQTWYLKQINGPFISRRAKVIRIAAPIVPANPGLLYADSSVIQANFNGDIRNMYGIELRGPDNATVLEQRPVGSIQDMYFDTVQVGAPQFWNPRNFLLFTEEFDNSSWKALSSNVTITPNVVNNPNGFPTADFLSFPVGNNLTQGVIVSNIPGQQPNALVGRTFTFSVWMRTSGGTVPIDLVIADFPFTGKIGVPFTTVTVNSSWNRYSFTLTVPAGSNQGLLCQLRSNAANIGLVGVYAWGAQLEEASTPGTYYANAATYEKRNLLQATEELDNSDFWSVATSPSVTGGSVAVTLPYNKMGIVADGVSFDNGQPNSGQGIAGYSYSNNLLGSSVNFAGINFPFGPQPNPFKTDNFAGGALSANWTVQQGTFTVAANTVQGATGGADSRGSAVRNDATYPADQFSQATIAVAPTNAATIGVTVRAATGAETFYAFYNDNTTAFLFKSIAGNITVLASIGSTVTVGQIILLRVVGTNLFAYKNGTLILSANDSSITSGNPGITSICSPGATTCKLSNFICGQDLPSNIMYALNQTVDVNIGYYNSLRLLAAGMNGAQQNQTIQAVYTDGTIQTFTQSFSDWFTSSSFTGEAIAKSISYRDLPPGTNSSPTGPFNVYHYQFALDATRKLRSLVFPANVNLVALAAALVSVNYAVIVTPNATADPLGNLTAEQINFAPNSGSGSQIQQQLSPSLVKNKTFTFSVWMRTSGANIALGLAIQDFPFTQNAASPGVTVTNQWQRFTITGTFNSSANAFVNAIIFNPSNVAVMAFVWGAQLEFADSVTMYLGNGNVLRPFYLYFFNEMWTYSQQTIVFIVSPQGPIVTLGNKFSNNVELRLDTLSRGDIKTTTAQLSQDGSFATGSVITVTGSGQPPSFNVNVANAAGKAFFVRAKRTDDFSDGAWSLVTFIPYGNIISSNWSTQQGSIPPTIDNQTTNLFTATATAQVGGGLSSGRIVITWPAFFEHFPDQTLQNVSSGTYDTGQVLNTSTSFVIPYIFYPRLRALPGSLPEFFNGAHTSQVPEDAQDCVADGYLSLGGGALSFTVNMPQAPASGSPSQGGGNGGGTKCIPIDEIIHEANKVLNACNVKLGMFLKNADPETLKIHLDKVKGFQFDEEECAQIELEDGSKGKCSKGTDIPVFKNGKFIVYKKPPELIGEDELFTIERKTSKIKSIVDIGMQKVVRIQMTNWHTIFAGDILTHNNFVPKQ